MVSKSTILHLRIPFSFYLLPFFCFALSQSIDVKVTFLILSFLVIHLFFYPASNGYNSYYDKDEESIGGLENPPPVNKELLYVSLLFDAVGLFIGILISWQFAVMILGIGMVSKAYSHPSIRLKKYPILGLLTVAFFQGAYTYLMSYIAITDSEFSELAEGRTLCAAGLCSLMLFGSYPMTQVYQHGEDGRRGDETMSRMLGILGTFYWTAGIFTITTLGFVVYFVSYYNWTTAIVFQVFLLPTLIYFFAWFLKVWKDPKAADFKSTMRLNSLSSCCFVAFFLFLYLYQFI
jgi:1,4-dihydroxy-2-naphthoate octaprenyltransferase